MSDAVAQATSHTPKAERMLSIDVLRGFDMFWIAGGEEIVNGIDEAMKGPAPAAGAAAPEAVAVSNGGFFHGLMETIATQLKHVQWEGFRFYDLIFPLFLFLIGVSIVFSLSRIVREEGKAAAHRRVFKRFVIMYLVGIFYYGLFRNHWTLPDGSGGIRLVGVLQRLALGYLFGSLLFLHLKEKGLAIALAVILIGYWALMSFVPAPGEPHVSFEPGRNIANYIDMHFVPGRMNDKTPDGNGGFFRWDPEGALSTIPAVGTAILGIFCGLLLKDKQKPALKKVQILAGAGALMVVLGFLWGGQTPWQSQLFTGGIQFPVIKKLWTSSYVLVAGGYSCLLVALFYYVVDIAQWRWWIAPFIWIGSNSLAVYLACNIFDFERLAARFVGGDISTAAGAYAPLLLACTAVLLLILFARWLYKQNIFIRI